ncbi:MAG TPA: hypothetical protein VIJ76_04965 [Galbitalea sp.]
MIGLVDEARAIMAEVQTRDLSACLIGGIAVRVLIGDNMPPAFERPFADIDILTRRADAKGLGAVLTSRGWVSALEFNALNGARRLLFHRIDGDDHIDVFVDTFAMCHTLPLTDGMTGSDPTLPATELMMTKLQIVELTAKDRNDLYALLTSCPMASGKPAMLDPERISRLTSRDWGLQHTFELNLQRLLKPAHMNAIPLDDQDAVKASVVSLLKAIDEAPKSRAWKLRARIGERKRWYEEPEEPARAAVAEF